MVTSKFKGHKLPQNRLKTVNVARYTRTSCFENVNGHDNSVLTKLKALEVCGKTLDGLKVIHVKHSAFLYMLKQFSCRIFGIF